MEDSLISRRPVALTIAGSDSGAGAGIQADLRCFDACGVHGTCAITCVTAQNPEVITANQPIPPSLIWAQIEAVFQAFRPSAIKTGALGAEGAARCVVDFLAEFPDIPLVVDPIIRASSGTALLEDAGMDTVKRLFRHATLITPNIPETEQFADCRIDSFDSMRAAAQRLHNRFGAAVLVKGGHAPWNPAAIDVYWDQNGERLFESDRIANLDIHGSGCMLSAWITGFLAHGLELGSAINASKRALLDSFTKSYRIGDSTHRGVAPERINPLPTSPESV